MNNVSDTVDYNTIASYVCYATNGFRVWNKANAADDPSRPAHTRPTMTVVRELLNADKDAIPQDAVAGYNIGILTYDNVLEYWHERAQKERGSFALDCYDAVLAGHATRNTLGAFCYAVYAAYNARIQTIRAAEEAINNGTAPCAHKVGERVDVTGYVTGLREFTSDVYHAYWGSQVRKLIVDFIEDDGTLYHFTTSAKSFFALEVGDRISMRCTIGDSKEFHGKLYTYVSRPVATKVAQAA